MTSTLLTMRRSTVAIMAAVFILVSIVATALRFSHLGASGFWYDEIIVSKIVQEPSQTFWQYLRFENHPPLYFLLVRWWAAVVGNSETTLRVLSAAFGSLAVGALALGMARIRGSVAGLAALVIGSTSSVLFFYSREARMYSLAALLATVSLVTYWRWLQRPGPLRTAAYLASTGLLIYTHYSGLALVFVQALFFLFDRQHHRLSFRRAAVVFGALGAMFLPWFLFSPLYRFLHPIGLPTWYTHANADPWGALAIAHGFFMFDSFPVPALFSWEPNVVNLLRPVVALLIAVLAFSGIVRLIRLPSSDGVGAERRFLSYLALAAAVPLLVALVTRMDQVKFYLPSAMAALMLAACGADRLWRRMPWIVVGCGATLVLFSAFYLPVMARVVYPWRPVSALLEAHERPGDLVLVHQWFNTLTLNEYYRGRAPVLGLLPQDLPAENDWVRQVRYNAVPVITSANVDWLSGATEGYQRVWFINNHNAPFFRSALVTAWFFDHGWVIGAIPRVSGTSGDFLTLFERRPAP